MSACLPGRWRRACRLAGTCGGLERDHGTATIAAIDGDHAEPGSRRRVFQLSRYSALPTKLSVRRIAMTNTTESKNETWFAARIRPRRGNCSPPSTEPTTAHDRALHDQTAPSHTPARIALWRVAVTPPIHRPPATSTKRRWPPVRLRGRTAVAAPAAIGRLGLLDGFGGDIVRRLSTRWSVIRGSIIPTVPMAFAPGVVLRKRRRASTRRRTQRPSCLNQASLPSGETSPPYPLRLRLSPDHGTPFRLVSPTRVKLIERPSQADWEVARDASALFNTREHGTADVYGGRRHDE